MCVASEVWSLRQLLQAAGHWSDDLPSNGNNTLVVAGLEGGLDLLTPEDAETWLGDAVKDALVLVGVQFGELVLVDGVGQTGAYRGTVH